MSNEEPSSPEDKKPLALRTDLTPQAAKIFRSYKKRKGLSSDAETVRLLLTEFQELEQRVAQLERKEFLLLKLLVKLAPEDEELQREWETLTDQSKASR